MRVALPALLALSLLAAIAPAFAGSSPQTGSFQVSATINNSCQVSATTNIAFGTYDTLSTTDTDAAGSVSVRCNQGVTNVVVTLDQGANPAAGSSAAAPLRQMASGTDRLPYQIYSDAARTTVWGDTAATGVTIAGPLAASAAEVLPTYGRIAAGQDAPAGAYTDTVGVTATF